MKSSGIMMALCMLAFHASAQHPDQTHVAETWKPIAEMELQAGEMQHSSLKTVSSADFGAAADLWKRGNGDQKVSVRIGLSNREVILTFYFLPSENLIAITEIDRGYDWDYHTEQFQPMRTRGISLRKCVFKQGNLIDSSQYDFVSSVSSKLPQDITDNLRHMAEKLHERLKDTRPTLDLDSLWSPRK